MKDRGQEEPSVERRSSRTPPRLSAYLKPLGNNKLARVALFASSFTCEPVCGEKQITWNRIP